MWGNPIIQHSLWKAHDPMSQAAGLKGTKVYVACARHGVKGPLDPSTAQAADPAEAFVWYTNEAFLKRLETLGIPATTHIYDKGTHSWPYWRNELHRAWPLMLRAIGV